MRSARSGVTLIELLLVVTIVMTLGVGGSLFYSRFLTQNSLSNTVDQLVQTLRKAQFYAMMSRKSNTTGWGVSYTKPTVTLYQGSSFGSRITALDERFTIPGAVTVSSFDINFARGSGVPNAPVTITASGLNVTKTVTVNSQGGVSR